jgi:hypothetical protein
VRGCKGFSCELEGGEKTCPNRVTELTPINQCGMFDALFLHEKVWGGGMMLLCYQTNLGVGKTMVSFNSFTAMDSHERPLFNELLWR